MIHYTCDCCKRPLDPADDLRYVVKMEVYASLDPIQDDLDDDRDNLQEMEDILESAACAEDEEIGDDVYRQMRFDLCADCHKRFVRHPLGQVSPRQLDFSEN